MNRLMVVLAFALLCRLVCADTEETPEWIEIHGRDIYTTAQKQQAQKTANRISKDFQERRLIAIADHANLSLRAIHRIAVRNLERKGYKADAAWMRDQWQRFDGFLPSIVSNDKRNIGDFKPLSTYLAVAYEILELKLGYQMCYTLRLTDIKTINFAIPVVFSPCNYTEHEFELHFIHDDKYRGLAPVVTYWTTVIVCSVATYGAGAFFVCSPVGMLTEMVMDRQIAPWLAPKIYEWAC